MSMGNFTKICLLLGSLLPRLGQAQTCGTGRYVADVFPTVQTTTGVVFGSNTNINYSTSEESSATPLYLDFYEPAGDALAQRPLIILAFGGSFVTGSRQDANIVALCQGFARKGYATAAIDYRLIQPGTNGVNYFLLPNRPDFLADEIVRAANDMRAAVRFFRAMASTYRINPTKIVVGGFSAGAITALQVGYTETATENSDPNIQAAYVKYGGLEGNTDLPGNSLVGTYNSQNAAAVFNLAGGINDLNLLNAGNPPLYSAQGTNDTTVPYNCGNVSYSNYTLCGSNQLRIKASQVGIPNQLYAVAGGNHSSPATDPDRSLIIADAATFLQPIVCAVPLPVTLTAFSGRVAEACSATLTWQTASEINSQSYEVQASADGQVFAPLGTVPSRNQPTGAAYTYRLGPLAGTSYFRLKMRDADGRFTYSPVLTLGATCAASSLSATPNPVQNSLTVNGLPNVSSLVLLYDTMGRLVAQARTTEATAKLVTEGLPAGIYLLKAQSETGLPLGSLKVLKE